ncbi:MAG: serine/threonine-protein kinase [Pyrinomonadaceae bacterium]
MTIASGTYLGRYEIRSQLGTGGMGEVYLARDTQLDRSVALKILPAHLATDEQRMKRFIQEARAISALNHPNIITIHEIGSASETQFIATEFVDGTTLRRLITDGKMMLGEKLEIAIQIASALAAAHAAGIVHRDIKPENIMVRHDGYAKVLDFGIAKLVGPHAFATDLYGKAISVVETDPGMVMGTFKYMSPEQTRGLAVDERSDIWSFGVVLYEMIAGRVPFGGETPSDVIAAVLDREPQPLMQYAPEAPAELERIANTTLAKDKEERYQTVKALLVDLRRLKRRLEAEGEPERAPTLEQRSGRSGHKAVAPDSELATMKVPREELAAQRDVLQAVSAPSGAGYLVSEIKDHKRGAMVAAIAALLIALAGVSYSYFNRSRAPVIPSLAVLPFVDSGDEHGYKYGDTIADGVGNILSNNHPDVRVAGRSVVFNYQKQETDPRKIGRELKVDLMVTGKVTMRGDTVIVQVDLIDVSEGTQVWGGQYNRRVEDIPIAQEEISRDIYARLRSKATGEEQHPVQTPTPYDSPDQPTRGQVP